MAQGASTCASFAAILVADSTNLRHLRHPSSIEMSHTETTMLKFCDKNSLRL
jgi:hypothetical protein